MFLNNLPDCCVESGVWGSKGENRETVEEAWSGPEEMVTGTTLMAVEVRRSGGIWDIFWSKVDKIV